MIDTSVGGSAGGLGSPLSPGAPAGGHNNLDDLLGVFDSQPVASPTSNDNGLLGGFESLNFGGSPPQPQQQQKRSNEDILGLF